MSLATDGLAVQPPHAATAHAAGPRLTAAERTQARRISLTLAGVCYLYWLAVVAAAPHLPWWLLPPLLGLALGLHSSLQHEALHGHMGRAGEVLMAIPLGLWCPYPCFRESHLRHHQVPLTDPALDPESFLLSPQDWARAGRIRRALAWANMTVAGRLTVGLWMRIARYLVWSAGRIARGEPGVAAMWAWQALGIAGVLGVAWTAGGIDPLTYVLAGVWPGTALLYLRAFMEHRPAETQDQRSIVVEAGNGLALLFLGNNWHWLHHARPDLPWPMLWRAWPAVRTEALARNGGYYIQGGYRALLARHLFRPAMSPVHPGETVTTHGVDSGPHGA